MGVLILRLDLVLFGKLLELAAFEGFFEVHCVNVGLFLISSSSSLAVFCFL